MNNVELIQKIYEWADARNLIKGSTPLDQGMKLLSELGELADRGFGRKNIDEIKDGIGDVIVVMTVIAGQANLLNVIKDVIGNLPKDYRPEPEEEFTNDKQKVLVLTPMIAQSVIAIDTKQFSKYESFFVPFIINILNLLARDNGLPLNECLQHSYNEIKDRKGVMYNGIFVKQDDPQYEDAVKAVEAERNPEPTLKS
jgi:NTP pyrophosphatase (non-canonical NTP hydrolase)